jgi:hypothetical protein
MECKAPARQHRGSVSDFNLNTAVASCGLTIEPTPMTNPNKAPRLPTQARYPDPEQPPERPDLQEWIARYGGYHAIPWADWDHVTEAWKAWLRSGDRYYQK